MTLPINKACPIVLRENSYGLDILAFEHPLAGFQIVKGTLEPGESPEQAAVRELAEESGLPASVKRSLGNWVPGFENHHWALALMRVDYDIPDEFRFFTQDDGGHWFRFFWQPLNAPLSMQWHPLFQQAIAEIRTRLSLAT
ncbi:NUDIX hydrolase [Reinekea blandensis]|uniref:Hydrolase, NUDIX family protein n=1 Tax=Reinekea blandensis MED297 TaxID=314283 RepID=A4BIC9_9GAMM|nr:NUDIX domain-containing protein [Reinekea blandensis]EAR08136.1 hydrolase, NUDIX family protein [Reinekea sp. MED297] [Reinekea blandensis MED297]